MYASMTRASRELDSFGNLEREKDTQLLLVLLLVEAHFIAIADKKEFLLSSPPQTTLPILSLSIVSDLTTNNSVV